MNSRIFSTKNREPHLGPYPLERLARSQDASFLDQVLIESPPDKHFTFDRPENPRSILNAMGEYQAMLDAIRRGLVNKEQATIPVDLCERAKHLKAFAYFNDASCVGICKIPDAAHLKVKRHNPAVDRLAEDLRTKQTTTLAAGVDMIMADLSESMRAADEDIFGQDFAIVFLYAFPRDPGVDEIGTQWVQEAQVGRAALRAAETASVIANYLRVLGFEARAHTATASDLDLNKLSLAAGLTSLKGGVLEAPFIGTGFGLAAVSTSMSLQVDLPLSTEQRASKGQGFAWWLGYKTEKSARNHQAYAKRRFVDGPYPFETLKRVEEPTTFIDEERIPRVPKRTDLFARAQFGDMGPKVQDGATAGRYVRKSAPGMGQRRALGAFILLQDGTPSQEIDPTTFDAQTNANNAKAAAYFLGADAVGISRCPEWAWYSHKATGEPLEIEHDQAISLIIDQGFETTDGSSGDDWISVAQSMRAYLRFSLLGGVLAKHIRSLGYKAKAHTVMDGEVLQPPLLLLSGLGEVSRIGEVILNPFIGPRLKSGVVTTDMPLAHDKPIDFGMQSFCEACNKCARECPSGAITAGPKLMFNGYEIWKSDSQKCATYRITTPGGAMCGRCMKTCPWNLEGLFAERPFRWAAMNVPRAAPILAKLDDWLGNGEMNSVKKWWWDIELDDKQQGGNGAYKPSPHPVNQRRLQKDLALKYEDQTLAVYPAKLAPHPWPFPDMMDRDQGIEAYQAMLTAKAYKLALKAGTLDLEDQTYVKGSGQTTDDAPVVRVEITHEQELSPGVKLFTLAALDGRDLPQWQAGAHIDIVVAPEFLRQYSLCGDPRDRKTYKVAVLNEQKGRGGSRLLHRIFTRGRKVFISKPINHFPLAEPLSDPLQQHVSLLFGGGIGLTPMLAMAHSLADQGRAFHLLYSCKSRESASFLSLLQDMPWRDRVQVFISDEGQRLSLPNFFDEQIKVYPAKALQVYTCGPEIYMQAVIEQARSVDVPTDQCHLEYFEAPEVGDYENHSFRVSLKRSNQTIEVGPDETLADALQKQGHKIDIKCSDGICGVCQCTYLSGDVEHRDFVLSAEQRKSKLITCQSRAAAASGDIELDL